MFWMFSLVNLHIRCSLHPEMNNQSEHPEQKTAPPQRVCFFCFFLLYPSFVSCTITDSVYAAKRIYPSCIYLQYLISCLFLWQTFVCDTAAWSSHVPNGVNKVISICVFDSTVASVLLVVSSPAHFKLKCFCPPPSASWSSYIMTSLMWMSDTIWFISLLKFSSENFHLHSWLWSNFFIP